MYISTPNSIENVCDHPLGNASCGRLNPWYFTNFGGLPMEYQETPGELYEGKKSTYTDMEK